MLSPNEPQHNEDLYQIGKLFRRDWEMNQDQAGAVITSFRAELVAGTDPAFRRNSAEIIADASKFYSRAVSQIGGRHSPRFHFVVEIVCKNRSHIEVGQQFISKRKGAPVKDRKQAQHVALGALNQALEALYWLYQSRLQTN